MLADNQARRIGDVGGGSGWDLTSGGIDVALFDALLADISDRYCVDAARIFSTGHSFGGFPALLVAGAYVERDDAQLAAAVGAFQTAQGLPTTGELDDATREALLDVHGS